MGFTLGQAGNLELTNQDGEVFELNNFQEVGPHAVMSKPSVKGDDETRLVTLTDELDGKTITALVTYAAGDSSTFDIQDIKFTGIPEGYEIESEASFEFEESDENDF
jgi:hypothetical protein